MINSIKFSNLRNKQLLGFLTDLQERCKRYDMEALQLMPYYSGLETITQNLWDVYNKVSGSDVTELIVATDGLRDSDIVGIRTVCEGYSYHRNSEIAEAAKAIVTSIDRHGSRISKQKYKEETVLIEAIVKDWEEQEQLKVALQKLNLNEWATQLKQENIKFRSLYQDRLDDEKASETDSFTALRVEATNAYKTLCDRIYAYSIISDQTEYTELMDYFNRIIEDYTEVIEKNNKEDIQEEA